MIMEVVEVIMASLEAKFITSLEGGAKEKVAEDPQDSVAGCAGTSSGSLPKGSSSSPVHEAPSPSLQLGHAKSSHEAGRGEVPQA